MFKVKGITFQIGDIVERWTPENHWKYWTTIHSETDVDMKLDRTFYRVVRGVEKLLIW